MTNRQQMEELAREVLRYFKMRDSFGALPSPDLTILRQREEWLKKQCKAILDDEGPTLFDEGGEG